ncbi:condensation domain-containing protein [Streptomyces sp. NPDC047315]|uniref:condensation domain-containing protein n=1 Tax=Streptomyces sp. NPDC047315 TaxID=3155142 RepID=UPI0033E09313
MDEGLPLLPPQLRTWTAQTHDLTNPVFSICDYLEIHGRIDPDVITAAHLQVEREVDALRLRIDTVAGEHRQFVKAEPSPLHRIYVSDDPDPRTAALTWIEADVRLPADPERLCTAALIETAPDRFLLYRKVHHAVMDGWSLALVFNRTAAVYRELAAGRSGADGALTPFSRLVEGEAAYRAGKGFARDREHWLDAFADLPEPVGPSRGRAAVGAGRRRRRQLAPELVAKLGDTAQSLGVTWSDLAVSAIAAYVGAAAGTSDVLLGLPTAGRLSPQARRAPGMVTNILPLRVPYDAGAALADHARRVSRGVREVLLHSRYPTAELSRDVAERGGSGRLWAAMVNVMLFDHRLDFAGAPATVHTASIPLTVDLTAYLLQIDTAGTVELILDTHPDLYDEQATDSHLEGLLSLLDAVAAAGPQTLLREVCPEPLPAP